MERERERGVLRKGEKRGRKKSEMTKKETGRAEELHRAVWQQRMQAHTLAKDLSESIGDPKVAVNQSSIRLVSGDSQR